MKSSFAKADSILNNHVFIAFQVLQLGCFDSNCNFKMQLTNTIKTC